MEAFWALVAAVGLLMALRYVLRWAFHQDQAERGKGLGDEAEKWLRGDK